MTTSAPFTPKISREDAAEQLHAIIAAADTENATPSVYVISRHVSASNLTRWVSLVVATGPDTIRDVTWLAAAVLGEKVHDKHGSFSLRVAGVEMNMHFYTVYRLAGALYDDGYALSAVTL